MTAGSCLIQVDDAAKSGRPLEAAEVRVQLEAHGRMVAKWLARAAKLLERVQGLRLRSESPGEVPTCVSTAVLGAAGECCNGAGVNICSTLCSPTLAEA